MESVRQIVQQKPLNAETKSQCCKNPAQFAKLRQSISSAVSFKQQKRKDGCNSSRELCRRAQKPKQNQKLKTKEPFRTLGGVLEQYPEIGDRPKKVL